MSSVLKLCILVFVLSLAAAKPVEREKRHAFIDDWLKETFKGAKEDLEDLTNTVKKTFEGAKEKVKDWTTTVKKTLEEKVWNPVITNLQAAVRRTLGEKVIEQLKQWTQTTVSSQELQQEGSKLLNQAKNLQALLLSQNPITCQQIDNSISDAIDTLTWAADAAIKTSQTISKNKDNVIKAIESSHDEFLGEAVKPVENVCEDVFDMAKNVLGAGETLVKKAKSADHTCHEGVEAIKKAMETTDSLIKAGNDVCNIGNSILPAGQSIVQTSIDFGNLLAQAVKL
ncbi:hypothetical protein PoB_000710800 [Plakobranchus ocellatus]|uniref:Uncharacterized protein n=1 Tax=Plakobranchus ocellatus TaxID=259542 RepID=A0AAV3YEQ4_9GAST|nr:hypothetical protein PoB_000710800 [Plakobranchus ocellatus]